VRQQLSEVNGPGQGHSVFKIIPQLNYFSPFGKGGFDDGGAPIALSCVKDFANGSSEDAELFR
jgi:hypothetical protein